MPTLNVHIALIGKTKEPVLKGFQFYGMDKLYLLHSQDTGEFHFMQAAEEVKKALAGVGFPNVSLVQIDPFNMHKIIESILHIVDNERQASIHINITGGTNLMAGAACSASFFVGAKAYYVLDERKLPKGTPLKDQIVELPIPNIPYARNLQEIQMKILKKLSMGDGITGNAQLRLELKMSPQKLSYHIKELEAKGLVTTKRGWKKEAPYRKGRAKKVDKRRLSISLTNSGKLLASWVDI